MVVLARRRGLEERELKLSKGSPCLLSLRRQRRDSCVGWIDDERGAPADRQVHRKRFLAEFAVDVPLGARRAAVLGAVAADDVGNLPIDLGAFVVRQELLVRVSGGPLQRDIDIPGPDSLEVRFAPLGLQCCRGARGDGGQASDGQNRQRSGRNRRRSCQQERSRLLAHGHLLRIESRTWFSEAAHLTTGSSYVTVAPAACRLVSAWRCHQGSQSLLSPSLRS